MLNGLLTDLVTPIADGALDLDAFGELVAWQIEQGTHGLVVGGRCSEAHTLTLKQLADLVQRATETAAGRVPIIACAPGTTPEAIIESIDALSAYAPAAIMLYAPRDEGRVTPDGAYEFLRLVHDDTAARFIIDTPPDYDIKTVLQLADLPRTLGVVDHTMRPSCLATLRRTIAKPFTLLAADDALAPAWLALGGHGTISAVANVAPALMAALHDYWRNADPDGFEEARDRLDPLVTALARAPLPATVKYALKRLGRCEEDVRLPLTPPAADIRANIDKALADSGADEASSAGLAA